jgi:hypothetical protein
MVLLPPVNLKSFAQLPKSFSSGPMEPHQRESEGEKIGIGESIDTNQRLSAPGPPGAQACFEKQFEHASKGRVCAFGAPNNYKEAKILERRDMAGATPYRSVTPMEKQESEQNSVTIGRRMTLADSPRFVRK